MWVWKELFQNCADGLGEKRNAEEDHAAMVSQDHGDGSLQEHEEGRAPAPHRARRGKEPEVYSLPNADS